jgi:hypothetical protein
VKTATSARACIREAIGQLLEYSLWPEAQFASRLVVVGEAALDEVATQYLANLKSYFNLPLEYEQQEVSEDVCLSNP